jgi:hypothetical protein
MADHLITVKNLCLKNDPFDYRTVWFSDGCCNSNKNFREDEIEQNGGGGGFERRDVCTPDLTEFAETDIPRYFL